MFSALLHSADAAQLYVCMHGKSVLCANLCVIYFYYRCQTETGAHRHTANRELCQCCCVLQNARNAIVRVRVPLSTVHTVPIVFALWSVSSSTLRFPVKIHWKLSSNVIANHFSFHFVPFCSGNKNKIPGAHSRTRRGTSMYGTQYAKCIYGKILSEKLLISDFLSLNLPLPSLTLSPTLTLSPAIYLFLPLVSRPFSLSIPLPPPPSLALFLFLFCSLSGEITTTATTKMHVIHEFLNSRLCMNAIHNTEYESTETYKYKEWSEVKWIHSYLCYIHCSVACREFKYGFFLSSFVRKYPICKYARRSGQATQYALFHVSTIFGVVYLRNGNAK